MRVYVYIFDREIGAFYPTLKLDLIALNRKSKIAILCGT